MLADFGLSRIKEEEMLNMLTEICGTLGVFQAMSSFINLVAFEIFRKSWLQSPFFFL